MTRPIPSTANATSTTPVPACGAERTDANYDAVERMMRAVIDEVPHPDLWDAIHAVQGCRAGGDARPDRMSPRYSAVAKRRSRSPKR